MIEGLKPAYNAFLLPLGRLFVRAGIHPNVLTVAGVVLYAIAGAYAAEGKWWLSVMWAVAGGFLDGLDGLVARVGERRTVFGGILDSCCDRLTEILWSGGLLIYFLHSAPPDSRGVLWVVAALTGGLMVSYVKARAEGAGLTSRGGVLQRPERLILFGLCLVVGSRARIWLLGGMALLAYATVLQRLVSAFLEARNGADGSRRAEAAAE